MNELCEYQNARCNDKKKHETSSLLQGHISKRGSCWADQVFLCRVARYLLLLRSFVTNQLMNIFNYVIELFFCIHVTMHRDKSL